MKEWQVQQAKQSFSEVVRRAQREGPQKITYRGEESAWVISEKDYRKMKKRKGNLEDWFQGDVLSRFKERILPVDDKVAKNWGHLSAKLTKQGVNVGVQDLYIAATAMAGSLIIVTLNTKDFEKTGISFFNPWD